ncbi:uncharacterized protein LOC124274634 [Haliotis rubra]|uniref:uncharacterized protein LOC124274634 n=1 Tax=Haliotis rubra TaxID=36100 RepID=UPI001EE595D6|nr:uncharacterized protein LOC124274634 [Haliotis rubra]
MQQFSQQIMEIMEERYGLEKKQPAQGPSLREGSNVDIISEGPAINVTSASRTTPADQPARRSTQPAPTEDSDDQRSWRCSRRATRSPPASDSDDQRSRKCSRRKNRSSLDSGSDNQPSRRTSRLSPSADSDEPSRRTSPRRHSSSGHSPRRSPRQSPRRSPRRSPNKSPRRSLRRSPPRLSQSRRTPPRSPSEEYQRPLLSTPVTENDGGIIFSDSEIRYWMANGLDLASPSKDDNPAHTYFMTDDDVDTLTLPPIDPIATVPQKLDAAFKTATKTQAPHLPQFNARKFSSHNMDPFLKAQDIDENFKEDLVRHQLGRQTHSRRNRRFVTSSSPDADAMASGGDNSINGHHPSGRRRSVELAEQMRKQAIEAAEEMRRRMLDETQSSDGEQFHPSGHRRSIEMAKEMQRQVLAHASDDEEFHPSGRRDGALN